MAIVVGVVQARKPQSSSFESEMEMLVVVARRIASLEHCNLTMAVAAESAAVAAKAAAVAAALQESRQRRHLGSIR